MHLKHCNAKRDEQGVVENDVGERTSISDSRSVWRGSLWSGHFGAGQFGVGIMKWVMLMK